MKIPWRQKFVTGWIPKLQILERNHSSNSTLIFTQSFLSFFHLELFWFIYCFCKDLRLLFLIVLLSQIFLLLFIHLLLLISLAFFSYLFTFLLCFLFLMNAFTINFLLFLSRSFYLTFISPLLYLSHWLIKNFFFHSLIPHILPFTHIAVKLSESLDSLHYWCWILYNH